MLGCATAKDEVGVATAYCAHEAYRATHCCYGDRRLQELQQEKQGLGKVVQEHMGTDPKFMEELKRDAAAAKEAANRWTDNSDQACMCRCITAANVRACWCLTGTEVPAQQIWV